MKRLISLFTLIAVWATMALAHDFEVNGIYYVKNSDGTSVSVSYKGTSYSQYSNEYSGSVTIPSYVAYSGTYYDVTMIGSSAFYGCSGLTSVTIPNSVTSIGAGAFSGCTRLTSVTIPNSVTEIGNSVFNDCSGLTSVTIPNSVTSIGAGAFSGCTRLTSVTIPNSVTEIGNYVFSYCSGLTSIEIPNSVTSIGLCAFLNCSDLTFIEIPNSVTEIGDNAFCDCSGLTSVTIPNTVTVIGPGAFSGCSGLTSVTIPNSVTSIGKDAFSSCNNIETLNIDNNNFASISYFSYSKTNLKTLILGNYVTSIVSSAFSGCTGLTSIEIPNSVTSIGQNAFNGCRGLTSLTIPNSVISVGTSAFQYCSDLTKVEISDLAAWCGISFGNTSSNPLSYAKHLYLNGSEIKDLVIPNTLTAIKNYTFCGCIGLTSVTIGNSVTSIGDYAFRGCSGLTSMTIGNFVTTIGTSAFNGCGGLTSVAIPNSVTSIGQNAFTDCSGLTKVEISDIAAWCRISFADNYSNPLNYAKHLYLNGSEIKDLVIPNTLTAIKNYTFCGCIGLTSVTIGNSVTSIGDYAFRGCSGLTSVAIGESVTSIGQNAFSDNSGLKTVNWNARNCPDFTSANVAPFKDLTGISSFNFGNEVNKIPAYICFSLSGLASVAIGESVTSIGDSAFRGCSGLTSVAIGESVTSIGNSAFAYCIGLTSVTIPNSVTSVGTSAFQNCGGLTSVTIGNSVASIGQNAFQNCSGLTSVTLPHSVTEIGNYAFQNCSGLASLTIGKSVSSIGSYAFDGCTSLTLVTDYSPTPQSVNAYVFNNLSLSNIDLMVPAGCSAAYRAVAPWKYFKSIEEILSLFFSPTSGEYEESVTVLITATVGSEIRYTLDGTEPASTSTLYTEPIVLNEIGSTTVIKAIAIKDGIISDVETATYTIKLAAPTITPSGGTYNAPVTVSMSAPQGSDIYFTTDGTDPSVHSLKYYEPFVVNGSCIIKAIAVSNNFSSAIISRSYVIEPPIIIPTTGVDPTSYPKKNGLTVTNLWLHSLNGDEREGAQYWANSPFAYSNYGRTSLIYGGKVYVAESRPTVVEEQGEPKTYYYATLHVIDALAGTFEKSITLTNNGQPVITPSPCSFNQIGVDNYGHIWGCGFTLNIHNAPLRPYIIDLETGTVTYVGECALPDEEESAAGRVDYMDVVGDITGQHADGILMAAPSNAGNIYAFRWRRAQGSDKWKGDFSNNKVAKIMSETYPIGLTKWGGMTVVKIVESATYSAEEFYIDDTLSNPVRYNVSGAVVDGFQNRPELAPKTGPNGVEEFTIGNHKMLAWVYNQYDVSYDADIASAGGCVIKVGELGTDSNFSDLQEYWTLPKEGLGMTSDGGCRIHNISTQKVTDNSGKEGVLLLTHKGRNGIGVYLVAEDGFDGTVSEIPESPVISPEAGVYEGSVTVSITSPTDGVAVRYTLDGTEPNSQSSLYVQPFTISELGTTEVKAVAVLGNTSSQIATASFTIISGILSTPTISPESGEYDEPVTVTISAGDDAEIHYTLDGTEPNAESTLYTEPFTLTETTTVKAIAFKDGMASEVASAEYVITGVMPGDVNDDGKVNVMDIVEMVSYIMGSPSATFVFAAADLDGNGTVNVMDLVNLVEMIMTSANQAAAKSSAKELMTVDCVELVNAGKNTVSVAFPGTEKFVAAQFTVELKNGNTLNDVTTDGNHRASFTEIGEGKYMVLVYSPDNSMFEGYEAIRLSVNNGKNVTIDNAVLVDVDKNAVTCNAVSSDNSCGVISIEADFSKPVDIYNINGQLVRKNATSTKGLDKGFYIINNNKIYLR